MARPREFDEQVVLKRALDVFWEQGYESTSLEDLTARMGIRRPSLYGAFGDKRQLFLAALTHYEQDTLAALQGVLTGYESPRAAIQACFTDLTRAATHRSGARGCFCVNTMVELAPHDAEIAERARLHNARVEALLAEVLVRGKACGDFRSDLNPQTMSRFLTVSLIGFQALLKSRPDAEYVADAVREVLALLEKGS